MFHFRYAYLILPALVGLTACGRDEPRTTQVIVQPPAQQVVSVSPTALGPPPAPQAELVPPPPPGPPVVWQPGHWRYTGAVGNEWAWQRGQYVPPPPGQTTWVQGQWVQQPTGSWVWVDGHWA